MVADLWVRRGVVLRARDFGVADDDAGVAVVVFDRGAVAVEVESFSVRADTASAMNAV